MSRRLVAVRSPRRRRIAMDTLRRLTYEFATLLWWLDDDDLAAAECARFGVLLARLDCAVVAYGAPPPGPSLHESWTDYLNHRNAILLRRQVRSFIDRQPRDGLDHVGDLTSRLCVDVARVTDALSEVVARNDGCAFGVDVIRFKVSMLDVFERDHMGKTVVIRHGRTPNGFHVFDDAATAAAFQNSAPWGTSVCFTVGD